MTNKAHCRLAPCFGSVPRLRKPCRHGKAQSFLHYVLGLTGEVAGQSFRKSVKSCHSFLQLHKHSEQLQFKSHVERTIICIIGTKFYGLQEPSKGCIIPRHAACTSVYEQHSIIVLFLWVQPQATQEIKCFLRSYDS